MASRTNLPAASAVAGVASVLADSLSPVLAYAELEPLLSRFDISASPRIVHRALAAALLETERFPQPRLAGIGIAQRNAVESNILRRAAYVVSATRRISEAMSSSRAKGETEETALRQAVNREQTYFQQHVAADASRITSAGLVDSLAAQYGDVLGWYADRDGKTTPECLAADGRNFRASDPPAIGYPGTVHGSCRCKAGPPHRSTEMLSATERPASSTSPEPTWSFDTGEFAQRMADYFGVTVELAKPRKKVSQRSVDYRAAGSSASHRCGTCVMYHASRCDLVEGFIQPDHVCDKWEAKPQALELATFTPGGPEIRHVRSARGVYFFKEPIGTPITEAEYQQLLAARRAAKEAHPVGHPDRVAAERAVRSARKIRSGGGSGMDIDTGTGDAVADEIAETQKSAEDALAGVQAEAAATGQRTAKLNEARQRLEQLRRERAGRELGGKANVAIRTTDKRIAQGQTVSHFVHPKTGRTLSKSEIGDTYETLFETHGAHLLEDKYGGTYKPISHAGGGARNTPLDAQVGNYGVELKSLSNLAQNQKVAIKKEEIDRKLAELDRRGLKPLLVAQVVDQQHGTVSVYTHPEIRSRNIRAMTKIGEYHYTPNDFTDANKRAGYAGFERASVSSPKELKDSDLAKSNLGRVEATDDEKEAAQAVWYGPNYADTNAYLRGTDEDIVSEFRDDPQVNRDIATFDSLIRRSAPSTASALVYRGLGEPYEVLGDVGDKVGSTFTDKGFVSTTFDRKITSQFFPELGPDAYAFMYVHLPPGTHILKSDPSYLTEWEGNEPDLTEYTLPTNTQFRIDSDSIVNGQREIHVTVIPGSTASRSEEASTAARLTDDEEYQRLLDERLEAKKKYPPGHPTRVAAEKAVRDARKKIHSGGTPTPKVTPTPTVRTPPAPPVSSGSGRSKAFGAKIWHAFKWSDDRDTNTVFKSQAEYAINKQFDHQGAILPQGFLREGHVNVTITDSPSATSSSALGTYGGTADRGTLMLHPKLFAHEVRVHPGIEGKRIAPFYSINPNEQPQAVLNHTKKIGWWVPTDNKWTLADNVIAHEIGHGINDSAFDRPGDNQGIPNDDTFWRIFAEILEVRKPGPDIQNEGTQYEKRVNTYESIAQWAWRNRAKLTDRISRYAAGGNGNEGTPLEMFAELWSEYSLSSNPRPPARFYGDYVKRILQQRAEEEAAREARRRNLPTELQSFSPSSLTIGEKITFKNPHVTVERVAAGHWDITLLRDDGSFRGAYGRSTPAEVMQVLEDEWLRRNPTEPAPGASQPAPSSAHNQAVRDLAEAEASGRLDEDTPTSSGNVVIAHYGNGAKFIAKHAQRDLTVDKEELAAKVSDIIGAGAPAVIRDRTSSRDFKQPFVDGKLPMELFPDRAQYAFYEFPRLRDSESGKRVGLFDMLTGNMDRHSGNWLVGSDDQVRPIDHGETWDMTRAPDKPFGVKQLDPEGEVDKLAHLVTASPFARENEGGAAGSIRISPSDFTPEQLSEWKSELEKLASDPELSSRQQKYMQYTLQTFERWLRGEDARLC